MKRRHTMTKRKERRKRKEKRMARITANQKRTHASSMLPVWPSGPQGRLCQRKDIMSTSQQG